MDPREKEEYLREYSILKGQGKPFFPYAIAKDGDDGRRSRIAVIILMAVLFGAELGPKADPTTTTYTPRPEWYFFFLFELLRVVKPPALVFMATIGIPTICLVLLLLLPFYDRGPERNPLRRPIATTAGIATIAAMAYLTRAGRARRARRRRSSWPPRRSTRRARRSPPRPAASAATRSARTATRSARTSPRSATASASDAIARTLHEPHGADAVLREPSGRPTRSSSTSSCSTSRRSRATSSERAAMSTRVRDAPRDAGASDVRPDRRRLRPDERPHDGRDAPSLARARR